MTKSWNDLEELEVNSDTSVIAQGDNNLLVVDALNLAFRYKHERYKDTNFDKATGFSEEYINTLESLANSYNCTHIVITADGKGGSAFRKSLYPEYKANRAKLREEQTELEEQAFMKFFEHYTDTLMELKNRGYPVLRFDGIEADDLAATVVLLELDYDHIWLVSSDKDWDLLISDKVSRFNWATQRRWKSKTTGKARPKEVTVANWREHHAFEREHYLMTKVLEGDKGDNIKGVPGFGPKRIADMVAKYNGDLQAFIDAIPLPSGGAYIHTINEYGEEHFYMNESLVNLTDYNSMIVSAEIREEIRDAL